MDSRSRQNHRSKKSWVPNVGINPLEVEASNDAVITFSAGPARFSFTLGEVRAGERRWDFGGLEQYVTVSTQHSDGGPLDFSFNYVDDSSQIGKQAYWVRIVQNDFHRAWSSPVYLTVS